MSKHKMLQIQTNKKMAFDKNRWRVFGNWLKTQRENANLSQDGLADLIGVDRQTIYRLENALSGTRRETVTALAAALKSNEAEALNKAGFAVQLENQDNSHEILPNVKISFEKGVKLSPNKMKKIVEMARTLARGVESEPENAD